ADVGQGRPDLLAVDDPLVAVASRLGSDAGQVRAGVGFGEPLAPQFPAQSYGGEKSFLLLGRAVVDQCRSDESLTDVPEPARGAGTGALLEVDHLHGQWEVFAAKGLGPSDAGPAVRTN